MEHRNFTKYFTSCKGVFQGGGCKAIAYIGAYKKAYERGVFFSELAGTSAGSVIAALIAAGAKPGYLEDVVRKMDFKQFITEYKEAGFFEKAFLKAKVLSKPDRKYAKYISKDSLSQYYGIFRTDTLEKFIEEHLQILTGLNRPVTFEDLTPNLHIVCADLEVHNVKVWNKENTPTESVAKAVCCSCCIPVFFRPVDNRYVDGGVLSNLPSFIFADEPHYNRILNFRLKSDEDQQKISSVKKFATSLIDTVVEGACNIQKDLSTDSFDVSIKVNAISSIDFDRIDAPAIDGMIRQGELAMDTFLDEELTFFLESRHTTRILRDKEQMRSLVSYISLEKQKEIYVSSENTYWCWELFLSMVRWITNGTKITIVTTSSVPDKHREEENSRMRMLKAMGCNLKKVESLPITGYFFMEKRDVWRGIVYKDEADSAFSANYYYGAIDSMMIKELVQKLKKEVDTANKPCKIAIKSVKPSRIIERLKTEPIYERATLRFENVNLEDLFFLNPYIRALKYKQIDKMYELYEENGLVPFTASALYFDKKESLIGPPIAERHNGRLFIIEGNTRCVYAYKHGIRNLQIVVVDDVTTPIPCDTKKTYKVSDILISDKKITAGNRYAKFDYSYFRHIEESIRPYKDYML